MHRTALLLACAKTVVANSGTTNCPCLTSFPNNIDPSAGVIIGGATYTYPATYGLSTCAQHDQNLPPTCDATSNKPEWCGDTWCYIDPANCELPTAKSSYFPGTTLHYSYSTCGSANTFTLWFGADISGDAGSGPSAPAAPPHVVGDLVTVIHDYLISLSSTLEENEPELRGSTLACAAPAPPSCPCATCRHDTEEAVFWTNSSETLATWNISGKAPKPYSFDFAAVSLTAKPSISKTSADGVLERCLSGYLENAFLRVAAREADISARVGYEYAAFQALGNYVQWPATQWCTSSYDPRLRSWYVSAASGPKDVVVVLDVSGSMRNHGRMGMMKAAARKLLKTFTDQDFVGFVKFSTNADAALGKSTLTQATAANLDALEAWVDGLEETGSTFFNRAFDKAFSLFESSADYSSGCTKAILFLSDGEPTNAVDYDRISSQAEAVGGVQIFTYALGTNAGLAPLKRIACMNDGALWAVPDDEAKLTNAMVDYYTFLAPLQQPCQVRWTYYNDINTGAPLLAACLATFKKEQIADATSCAGGNAGCMPELLGVACMDVSLIATQAQIDGRADAQSFYDRVISDQRACQRVTPTAAQLQALRARIDGASYGDAVCSAADGWDSIAPAACTDGSGGSPASSGSGPPSAAPPPAPGSPDGGGGGGMGLGAQIGIGIGGLIVLLAGFSCWRTMNRGPRHTRPTQPTQPHSRPPPMGQPVQAQVPVVQAQCVSSYQGYAQPGVAMGRPVA